MPGCRGKSSIIEWRAKVEEATLSTKANNCKSIVTQWLYSGRYAAPPLIPFFFFFFFFFFFLNQKKKKIFFFF